MKNISELNPYDLDEYLGPVWERETISKKVATPPPPVDPLPILNTIDLNVLMESDDEPVIETVMILGVDTLLLELLGKFVHLAHSGIIHLKG